MAGPPQARYRLMIVDDDELTREVLTVLAEGAGYAVEAYASGLAALESMERRAAEGGTMPQGVLADLQMPGPSGETFARLARNACGAGTVMLAMSAAEQGETQAGGYDGFLRKPFSVETLAAALAGGERRGDDAEAAMTLDMGTFSRLSRAMRWEQMRELYQVCLEDAEERLGMLRRAAAGRDEEGWRAAAHALRGSCGMVGARELASMAEALERSGLAGVGEEAPFAGMVAAIARLRRTLDARMA